MATVITDDKHYKAIAEMIREKANTSTLYKPSEMADGVVRVYAKGNYDGYDEGYEIGHSDGYLIGENTESEKRDAQEAQYLADINAKVTGYGVNEAETLSDVLQAVDEVYNKGGIDGAQSEYDRFWDAYQQNGNRTHYGGAFGGTGWTKDTFKPKYPIIPVGTVVCDFMFYNFNRISVSGADDLVDFADINIDFSGSKRFANTFQDARIKNLFVDASNATNMSSAFNAGNGGYIENLTLKVTSKVTTFSSTFAYQKYMKEIRFTDDSEIAVNISFNTSTNLTKESIESIVNALSSSASGKTLTLSLAAVNNAFETSDGAADGSTSTEWTALIATKTNWTISLS